MDDANVSKLKSLYDKDFVAWTKEQAEALRAAARGGTNQPVDWENLAEEIESLGKSDRRALTSQVYRILRHLAKLQFSQVKDPRHGWRDSVRDGRLEAELVLADSPSLRPQLERIVAEQTPKAMERALLDLRDFGEVGRATERALRQTRYTTDQVLSNWFPAEPTS